MNRDVLKNNWKKIVLAAGAAVIITALAALRLSRIAILPETAHDAGASEQLVCTDGENWRTVHELSSKDADKLTQLVTEKDGNGKIPIFVTKSGIVTKSLYDLNMTISDAADLYQDAKEAKGKDAAVFTKTEKSSSVEQATVYLSRYRVPWNENKLKLHDRNLLSIAYDRENDHAIFCSDALLMTGIEGAQLSRYMQDAVENGTIRGEIEETDMQGFHITDDLQVDQIYMKLKVREKDTEESVEMFYNFNPKTHALTRMDFPDGRT
ncbi:MAG: hypothetical protein PUF49_11520 [Firmicutes bacterium]|nr:hypothetical protein [Bacillota bacterium]